jgi:CO/xanthine dehydrogenase Mo-binding subunit
VHRGVQLNVRAGQHDSPLQPTAATPGHTMFGWLMAMQMLASAVGAGQPASKRSLQTGKCARVHFATQPSSATVYKHLQETAAQVFNISICSVAVMQFRKRSAAWGQVSLLTKRCCHAACLQERPEDLQARLLQLRNLMMQGMGREREVPHRAIRALREAGACADRCAVCIQTSCLHCTSHGKP